MILERLGIITDEVSQDLLTALDWVKENELKHVEIRMVNHKNIADFSDRELDAVLEEVEQRNLFISCVASPVFKCALDPDREVATGDTFGQEEETVQSHFQKLDRMIHICNKLNVSNIRIFSFWREKNPEKHIPEVVRHLKRAADIAAEANVTLLLENEGSCNGGFASEVASIVRQVNSPYLKVLWDPGNEAHANQPAYPEGYKHVQGLIGHVHLKDAKVDEHGEGYCLPIGEGNVAFKDQIKSLEESGYKGLYTIETHYIPEGSTAMEGSQKTLDNLRAILEYLTD